MPAETLSVPRRLREIACHVPVVPREHSGEFRLSDVERQLSTTGNLRRAISKHDPRVKGWIEDPKTYPEGFRGERAFLFGLIEPSDVFEGDGRYVPSLRYLDGNVIMDFVHTDHIFDDKGEIVLVEDR